MNLPHGLRLYGIGRTIAHAADLSLYKDADHPTELRNASPGANLSVIFVKGAHEATALVERLQRVGAGDATTWNMQAVRIGSQILHAVIVHWGDDQPSELQVTDQRTAGQVRSTTQKP